MESADLVFAPTLACEHVFFQYFSQVLLLSRAMLTNRERFAYVDPFDRVCLGLGRAFRPSATTAWQERSAL